MWVYYNGRIIPKKEVSISPDDRGFVFGDGVYEVLSVNKGHFLEEDAHYDRLAYSLSTLDIPIPDLQEIQSAVWQVLERNDLIDGPAMVYLQLTRGVAPRRHPFPDVAPEPTVYITAQAYTPPWDLWEQGVEVIVLPDQRWGRCDIKSLNLLPNVLASQQAKVAGAYDALLHRDGVITEGSHTGVCCIRHGILFTHPLTKCILPSVTRGLVLRCCAELRIPVREQAIPLHLVHELDELMVLGTTTEVMPVVRVEGHPVGDGRPGPITRKLQQAVREKVTSH
ncbi:MAG: aminotransferase class IV [Anaerolineae bacterium]|nr:aminotransferase class IV [Anaerolineae bacterium]